MKCKPIPISEWDTLQKGPYKIIFAKTPCQSRQGLQGARFLKRDSFIFFVNIKPKTFFHTNNCYFPIDVISLDSRGIVLNIWTAFPGKNKIGPMPPYTANVVETHAGWCKKNGITIGDSLPFFKV